MKIKRILGVGMCVALLAGSLLCVSCKSNGREDSEDTAWREPEMTEINYDGIDAGSYIANIEYKGLNIALDGSENSRVDTLWRQIYDNTEIYEYPAEKVDYYFNQTKKAYMSSVGYNQGDYELLLKNRNTDEQKMRNEACDMVLHDLVYKYIVDAEGISLTDEDKAENFDKYVTKYCEEFKKSREYVVAEMSEYIYESMLYDKTVEFLLLNNSFTEQQ